MARAPRLGLALGSGAARGWSHIGVLEVLEDAGIPLHVVCGSSIGALVGAAYASGRLAELKDWVLGLERLDVLRLMDPTFSGSGFIQGERLMEVFAHHVPSLRIEDLPLVYACTATDLVTGAEVWIRDGDLSDAVRASIALPGLFTPVRHRGRWVVDGGLTDPVPVSLCRSLGADHVIAVNLNGGIVGKHLKTPKHRAPTEEEQEGIKGLLARLKPGLGQQLQSLLEPTADDERPPGLLDVMATSINIMQDRITRSRLAGDPPEVLVMPRLRHVPVMEFHRAREVIPAGAHAARQALPAIQAYVEEAGG